MILFLLKMLGCRVDPCKVTQFIMLCEVRCEGEEGRGHRGKSMLRGGVQVCGGCGMCVFLRGGREATLAAASSVLTPAHLCLG